MEELILAVPSLSKLDTVDLSNILPEGSLSTERDARGASHGDALTITAVVVVSVAALKALSVWLAKSRKGGRIERVLEVRSADGSVRREELRIEGSESAIEAQVLQQLAALTKTDLSVLQSASGE